MNIEIISFIWYFIISMFIYIITSIKKKDKKSKTKIIKNKTSDIKLENDNNFIIDGKDCSFIFNDPNKENAMKNYYILLTDVNARLTNGYTLDENIRINNILTKLRVTNINDFNLMNMEVLSKISVDEYNLLKSYIENIR